MSTDDSIEIRESKVTYTTKELLARIDQRMERLEQAATAAATRVELEHLEARVSRLEEIRSRQDRLERDLNTVRDITERVNTFISDLEAVKAHRAAVFTKREKVVAGLVGATAIGVQLVVAAFNVIPT